jgi:4'-phosphopantetheinyl transferase
MPDLIDISWHDLDAEGGRAAQHWAWLSGEERIRAASFQRVRDRWRYVARHGLLREMLALRLGCAPDALRFTVTEFGKPALAQGGPGFSLSHSRGLALIAIADRGEIGCDIEKRDPSFACAATAERFFAPAERRTLASLRPADYCEGFYNCWTRKEAYLKALGCGLSRPLDSFEVSLAPAEPARLLAGCDGWSVAAFMPLPLFHAALVARGSDWQINLPQVLAA